MRTLVLLIAILFITAPVQANKSKVDYSIPFNQWASDLAIICSNYDFSQYGDYSLSFAHGNEDVFYVTTQANYGSENWKPKVLAVYHTDGDHCAGYTPSEAKSFIEGFPQKLPIGLTFPHANRELFNCSQQLLNLKAQGYSLGRPEAHLIKGKRLNTHVYKYPIIDIYSKKMSYSLYSFSKVLSNNDSNSEFKHGLCQIK